MITVSIVSHGQMTLVDALLADLANVASPCVSAVLVTCNLPERAPLVPDGAPFTIELVTNAAPKGFGANHNAAFARSMTPSFAILNPDLRIAVDPFPALLAAFDRDALLALVAPRIVAPDGRAEDAARLWLTPWNLLRRRVFGRDRGPAERPEWLAGMFLLARADAFRAVGGFDERYFLYCEDADLSARVVLAGWRFAVVDGASATHAARRDSHGSMRHLYLHLTSLSKMWLSPTYRLYGRLLAQRRTPR